ncbi:MAG: hypothetical protein MHPSP_003080 [Paramarteilia canceri]
MGGEMRFTYHYERLEFLGDSILEMLASIIIFYKYSQTFQEGVLTKYRVTIVNNSTSLICTAQSLMLSDFILAQSSPIAAKTQADVVEALFGAIYLQRNMLNDCWQLFEDIIIANCKDADIKVEKIVINSTRQLFNFRLPYLDTGKGLSSLHTNIINELKFQTEILINDSFIFLLALNPSTDFFSEKLGGNNQNLEWLGDSILKFIVSLYLFKNHKTFSEGLLSQIRSSVVSNDFLFSISKKLKLDILSQKLNVTNLSHKRIADLLEALLAAIFLDTGLDQCIVFTKKHILSSVDNIIKKGLYMDPRDILQQIINEKNLGKPRKGGNRAFVQYRVTKDNNSIYHSSVLYNNRLIGKASASAKKDAKKEAAMESLHFFKDRSITLQNMKKYAPDSVLIREIYS